MLSLVEHDKSFINSGHGDVVPKISGFWSIWISDCTFCFPCSLEV